MTRFRSALAVAILATTAAILSGCSDGAKGAAANGDGALQEGSTTAVRVAMLTVQPHRLVVYDELPGRVSALRVAEIRPQVGGIIQKVIFSEGAEVAAEEPLFQIDPAPFAADVEAAEAVKARAEADLGNATLRHDRIAALAATATASAAALADAKAALAQARANVAEATANLARRQLELAHATIRSPIAGRIGQALVTEGGLATVGAATPLAVVQQLDHVYLDIRQPATRRELLEEMMESGRSETAGGLPVEILTITGRPYEFKGKLLFADSTVDPGTGNLTLRIDVPNPAGQLLPGMYLRARMPSAVYPAALTVPQQAERRTASGEATLTILGRDNAPSSRTVELGPLVDRDYVVLSGLAAGETVVVEGQDRADGSQPLDPVPYRPLTPASES